MELTDDNGDSVADTSVVAALLTQASDIARSALYPAFTSAQAESLASSDSSVKAAVVEICCGLAGSRRLHLLSADGRQPFYGWLERAEQKLRDVAAGKIRAVGEATAGANPNVSMNATTTEREQIFSGASGSGGF